MEQQPRGRPPSTAPPPAARGRNALTALGGGVLVLAIAGGAWALFGRDDKKSTTATGTPTTTSSPAKQVLGPVAPGTNVKPAATSKPTSTTIGPVAATQVAATTSPKPASVKAAGATRAPTPTASPASVATKAPVVGPVVKPVTTPPVTGPQQGGTVTKKAYTFKVARGDTLWDLTKQALASSGRSTSNADVVAAVHTLFQHNQAIIGSDPNLILPGQVLTWPAGL